VIAADSCDLSIFATGQDDNRLPDVADPAGPRGTLTLQGPPVLGRDSRTAVAGGTRAVGWGVLAAGLAVWLSDSGTHRNSGPDMTLGGRTRRPRSQRNPVAARGDRCPADEQTGNRIRPHGGDAQWEPNASRDSLNAAAMRRSFLGTPAGDRPTLGAEVLRDGSVGAGKHAAPGDVSPTLVTGPLEQFVHAGGLPGEHRDALADTTPRSNRRDSVGSGEPD
jgi:hypothetical protein